MPRHTDFIKNDNQIAVFSGGVRIGFVTQDTENDYWIATDVCDDETAHPNRVAAEVYLLRNAGF